MPVTATNSGGTASQTITLTVKAAGTVPVPTFTSAAAATAATGRAFSFTVTTVGSPTSYTTNVTRSGALPGRGQLQQQRQRDGHADRDRRRRPAPGPTRSRLPRQNTGGTTTQSFVLTVTGAPAITSATTATATVGSGFSFTVRRPGAPAPALAEAGALPQGLTWVDNHNGTATLAGTPGVDQGGVYKLTITATNSGGTAAQAFTLTVDQAPAITSAATATATHGKPYTFTFTSIGYPVASVTHTGTVPGLTYLNPGNGTADPVRDPDDRRHLRPHDHGQERDRLGHADLHLEGQLTQPVHDPGRVAANTPRPCRGGQPEERENDRDNFAGTPGQRARDATVARRVVGAPEQGSGHADPRPARRGGGRHRGRRRRGEDREPAVRRSAARRDQGGQMDNRPAGKLLTAVNIDLGKLSAAQRAGQPGAVKSAGAQLAADVKAALAGPMPPADATAYRAGLNDIGKAGTQISSGNSSRAGALLAAGNGDITTVTAAANESAPAQVSEPQG